MADLLLPRWRAAIASGCFCRRRSVRGGSHPPSMARGSDHDEDGVDDQTPRACNWFGSDRMRRRRARPRSTPWLAGMPSSRRAEVRCLRSRLARRCQPRPSSFCSRLASRPGGASSARGTRTKRNPRRRAERLRHFHKHFRSRSRGTVTGRRRHRGEQVLSLHVTTETGCRPA